VKFYLGVCRLLEGHPADSVAPLKAVVAGPSGVLTQSGHYYLAKAYLQMGKLEDAESEMRAAAALPGRLTAEARALVERIKKVRQQNP
jgi:lipoprotein NlpI